MTDAPETTLTDAERARVRERLEQLVRIESPSWDEPASAQMAHLLERWWREAGAEVRLVETAAGTSLVADLPGRGDPVLLVGHSDTVWPIGTLAGAVPWVRDGDLVRGPGVYDMKSGLVAMLAAVERVRGLPHRAVRVAVVADEEVGSPTTGELLRESAVGVSAVLGFESPHPDGAFKSGRRGSTRVRLRVTGRAAHAALDPGAGISAIDELVDQLTAVRELTADPGLPSEVLCNVGTITGGTRANVVAATAEAEIGLRFLEAESEERVLAALAALAPRRAGAVVEVDVLSHRPAWLASDADRALAERLFRAARRCGQDADARPAAGAGDTNAFGSWGLPTIDGLGPRGGGAHAVSEHASLESLEARILLLAQFLVDEAAASDAPTRSGDR